MDLDEYQRRAAETDVRKDREDRVIPLLGLAGEIGELATEYKKHRRDGAAYRAFPDAVREELGDILWYAATVATTEGLSLNDIAQANLVKTHNRFLRRTAGGLLDEDVPTHEQFPREFTLRFEEVDHGGVLRSRMWLGEEPVGDPLTDNAVSEDHYRFHDAFHAAHAAVLGWSPVLRMLMKRKRKSDEVVDETQDGARAIATEEAISALVFEMAKPYSYFEGIAHVPTAILDAVRSLVGGLEVAPATAADWESAIVQGYTAWRALREHRGGLLHADLNARTLRFAES
jgi:NTP pyrophosphatase (non-canonical NTP hydrolase)